MAKYKVGLGVSGGIAAYKAVEVLRLLQRSDCEVTVAMTKHKATWRKPVEYILKRFKPS